MRLMSVSCASVVIHLLFGRGGKLESGFGGRRNPLAAAHTSFIQGKILTAQPGARWSPEPAVRSLRGLANGYGQLIVIDQVAG